VKSLIDPDSSHEIGQCGRFDAPQSQRLHVGESFTDALILPEDTRHLPIREWARFGLGFRTRRIFFCVLHIGIVGIIAGNRENCRTNGAEFKMIETVWWRKS
jgi:hypothetical protein